MCHGTRIRRCAGCGDCKCQSLSGERAMTAAERKVRERYPDATCVEYKALAVANVWATTGGRRVVIARGVDRRTAWEQGVEMVRSAGCSTCYTRYWRVREQWLMRQSIFCTACGMPQKSRGTMMNTCARGRRVQSNAPFGSWRRRRRRKNSRGSRPTKPRYRMSWKNSGIGRLGKRMYETTPPPMLIISPSTCAYR